MQSGGGDSAIAFDADGSPRAVIAGTGGLRYAYQGKKGWVIQDLPVSGALPAMAIDSTGTPHITCYSGGSSMTYLTRGKDGKWYSYPLEGMGGSVGTYGKGEVNHHLRVDSKDNLHLLYYNDVNPGRLVYGFMDETGWKLTDVAAGVTSRNNWLDLNEDDEPFAGWYDTDRFVWARKSENWVPHKLGLLNDKVTEQGHFCAMVVLGKDTVKARFWGTYRWKDSYGAQYADDVFIQAVTPDGGTVLLNNATLAPGEPLYSPGPTIMYKNAKGGVASVSYRDGGLWGAFGGRIPVNLGHWASAYGYAVDFPTGNEAAVWLQDDGVLYFEGPDKPTEDAGGGGPWSGGMPDLDVVTVDSVPSCNEPDAGGERSWQAVGELGFSAKEAYQFSLAADQGVVWAAYRDSAAGNRLTVQRYSDCQWKVVGSAGMSAGEINIPPSISLYEGNAWVAYADASLWDTVIVKQYGGAGWLAVGGPNSLGKPTNELSLMVVNGLPYVAMARSDKFYRPSVMRFNTVQWEPLGDEFLSEVGTQAIDLFLYEGFVGVAFSDGNQGGAATARQYDAQDKKWVAVGADGFTPGEARPLSMASGGGVVWAAYSDAEAESKVSVMKFDGDSWQQVGKAGFSEDAVKSVSIGADYNGIPFLAYESVPGKAEIVTFDGKDWLPVGDAAAYMYLADEPVLHVAPDGTVYLAFSDQAAGGKLSVIQYR